MTKLVMVPQFIDRAGRTVYYIHEDDPDTRTLTPGKMLGSIRLEIGKTLDADLEWLDPDQQQLEL